MSDHHGRRFLIENTTEYSYAGRENWKYGIDKDEKEDDLFAYREGASILFTEQYAISRV
jgi:hypothetical protein